VHCEFDVPDEAFWSAFRDEIAFFKAQRDRIASA